jgi:hypothetical protein
MPIVFIHGLPASAPVNKLAALREQIKSDLAAISALKIEPGHVTVCMPADRIQKGQGKEIIATIHYNNKAERTFAVRKAIGQAVCDTLAEWFPNATFIECLPTGYSPEVEGYASLRR